MKTIEITAFDIAQRYVGTTEVKGMLDNPQIMAFLRLDNSWPVHDEVPWCSAFVNYVCWLLRLPRSKSLAARSWLLIGSSVGISRAEVGFTVVILKRGGADQPGPEVLNAQGHVGFFAGVQGDSVLVLGGNQDDTVNVDGFPIEQVLGLRILYS